MNKKQELKRDKSGLITNVDYVFNEDGMVDWRKMVKDKWLVPNRDMTKKTETSELSDRELLILLGGIKELAQIRGFTSVKYDVVSPSSDYVVVTCSIEWVPNYETEGISVTFSGVGDASPTNTSSFTKYYLGAMAENRAFVRCVRNFLKINIVGKDEIGEIKTGAVNASESDNLTDPRILLEKAMREKGLTFAQLKAKLVKEEVKNAENFEGVQNIPKLKVFELIERIKKAKIKA
jgi:hypothetical protein